jgi:hypothetical protein
MISNSVDERQSWTVKDAEIHAELSELMDLTDDDCTLLSDLKSAAEERARSMTDDFYERLFKHDHTKEYFEGQDMDRLHAMIGDWFSEIFSGDYSPEYVKQRLQIGYIHVKIGLPVRYPLAMIDIVSEHGQAVAETSGTPDAAKEAFRKVLALDIAIFNQAYEDNQLKHLSELVGGERLARRLLMGVS